MGKISRTYDLTVIGGGPAGATLAAITKKYNPSKRILLLEREKFPRHHIGESLLPAIVPILKEMGVFSKIENAGFLKKGGAVYSWGRNRRPWSVPFGDSGRKDPDDWRSFPFAWQVHRPTYDKILLEHAREMGVEVLETCQASDFVRMPNGPGRLNVRSVSTNKFQSVDTELLADCSGQKGFLARYLPIRKMHRRLSNLALYAYFKCNPFSTSLAGTQQLSRIAINAVEGGWIWYIPISSETVSVGFVCKRENFQGRTIAEPLKFYEKKVMSSPRVKAALRGAERIRDVDGTGRDFFIAQDYSYENRIASGPGWVAAGDAAYFVDPIISTGVFMAQMTGLRAAYTINSQWGSSKKSHHQRYWADYNAFVRRLSGAFFEMALYWYGEERSTRRWCALARELTRGGSSGLEDFVRLTTGSSSYQSAISPDPVVEAELELTFNAVRRSQGGARAPSTPSRRWDVRDHWRPRLNYKYRTAPSTVMQQGRGILSPVMTIQFNGLSPKKSSHLNPIRTISPESFRALSLVDGRRSVGEIVRNMISNEGLSEGSARFIVNNLLQDLSAGGCVL